jgi:drug/metabolite transporter (DMT)-like permease
MSSRQIALLAVVFVGVTNAAVFGITKKSLDEIPPLSFMFLRFLTASLFLLPFFIKEKNLAVLTKKELLPFSLLATGNVIFFVYGINLTTANLGSVAYAAVPLLAGIILYYYFKEKISINKMWGILIGFIGVIIVTLLPVLEKGNPFSGNIWGNMLIMMGVIIWSFYVAFSKKMQSIYSPFLLTGHFIFLSTMALFPFFLWETYTHMGWWNNVTAWGIGAILYVGIIVTILGYTLQQYAIKHGGAVFASTTFYVTPVLAFVVNFFLLGEILTPAFIFGSTLALIGTYLVVKK